MKNNLKIIIQKYYLLPKQMMHFFNAYFQKNPNPN